MTKANEYKIEVLLKNKYLWLKFLSFRIFLINFSFSLLILKLFQIQYMIENKFEKMSLMQLFVCFFFMIRTIIIGLLELLMNEKNFKNK
jgi:hypothetical protein